ncbi:hypothetical protein LMJ16_19820, partial [Klebsiella pneumoniae]|nr:hypothetical protein [Klebsiella pneumoniae]
FSRKLMPVSNYYQAQPDCYVRFDWGGLSLEGEFFSYEEYGRDIDPKWGYIRPFDRAIRQQLIDNLQATHGIDSPDIHLSRRPDHL